MVSVDVIETDRGVAHTYLAGARIIDLNAFPLHFVRTTGFMNTNRIRHSVLLSSHTKPASRFRSMLPSPSGRGVRRNVEQGPVYGMRPWRHTLARSLRCLHPLRGHIHRQADGTCSALSVRGVRGGPWNG